MLKALLPYEDPNFGLDEGWAHFYPYASQVRPGEALTLSLRIMNHSPVERNFSVKLHPPEGWTVQSLIPEPIRINSREEGSVQIKMTVPAKATPGLHILTADLGWDKWELREWSEAMVWVGIK